MKPIDASQPSSRTSSTAAAGTDSLRPRNRRLISGLDGNGSILFHDTESTRAASPRRSPSRSRSRPESSVSSLPNRQPSRTSVRDIPTSHPSRQHHLGYAGSRQSPSSSFTALWDNSWKTWQGLTSQVLGSDGSSSNSRAPSSSNRIRRLDVSPRPMKTAVSQWGPAGSDQIQIGSGSREERETLVRAAKRQDLMRANGGMLDLNGNHKRRGSDDFSSSSVQPGDQDDRDALVYLHHVRPQDTLMGLTIRFHCQPEVLRKANRLWPNDPIQSRKTIVLPVDACGVKGRPVPDSQPVTEERDLLGDFADETLTMHESPVLSSMPTPIDWSRYEPQLQPTVPPPFGSPSSTPSTNAEVVPLWKHDSWVLLPNETEPVEIARLPRRHLGFFPRARRKSQCFFDLDSPGLTPKTSMDTSRIPPSPGSPRSEAHSPRGQSISRNRSPAIAAFPASSFLHGPGGVGTLGKNVRTPGPGLDRLNELLGPHLPNVAPPPSQTVYTPFNPGLTYDNGMLSSSVEYVSASAAFGNGADFQDVGSKIERWVRRTAKSAATALQTSGAAAATKGNAGVQGMGAGSGIGDLIELTDAFEIGDEGERERDSELISSDVNEGLSGSSSASPSGGNAGDGVRGRRLNRDGVGVVTGKNWKDD